MSAQRIIECARCRCSATTTMAHRAYATVRDNAPRVVGGKGKLVCPCYTSRPTGKLSLAHASYVWRLFTHGDLDTTGPIFFAGGDKGTV